jgi:hypothetical protein
MLCLLGLSNSCGPCCLQVPEIKRLTEPEIAALRKELDGIKVWTWGDADCWLACCLSWLGASPAGPFALPAHRRQQFYTVLHVCAFLYPSCRLGSACSGATCVWSWQAWSSCHNCKAHLQLLTLLHVLLL